MTRERAGKLRLDQLALALRNLGPNHFLMPMFAAIICVMYHRWVSVARLETWFALCKVLAILVFLVVIAMSLAGFRALDRRWRRWRTRR